MRAASDIGGTFTDLVYYEIDRSSGQCAAVKAVKADTTPPNFERGVMNSLEKANVDISALEFFAHGSTVVINALTERKGVKTGLITTKGFRDVLEIARGNRPDLFNFNFRKPKPFVERFLRAEIDERISYKGEVLKEADLSNLEETVECFKSEGVKAVAISFLHSYMNPVNEIVVAERVKSLWPDVSILTSHEISKEWREYERTNTTVLSAYVHPIAERYIDALEAALRGDGFSSQFYLMQSSGGIATSAAAKANPITMVESGPASGIYAAAYLGQVINEKNLIVLDIGGTTAKCTLIADGDIKVSTEYYIEKDAKNPGYPIQTPVSEIVEIGNGGGSIAWLDEGGKLHVGPQSAGAMPGPAAYGRGGDKPTTTDANLLLGRIDPHSFVGGEVEPDWDAITNAFEPLARTLGASIEEAALGVVRIANSNMANALRLVSTNKGYDPRDFALIAFGGGGAMHAVALAEELKIPKVIVPVNSSVFSAWGMLLTDLRRDYIQTNLTDLSSESFDLINRQFAEMRKDAVRGFASDSPDIDPDALLFQAYADMRYVGQEHTVKVMLSEGEKPVNIEEAQCIFNEEHEKRFTYQLDVPVQLVNYHLVCHVPVVKLDIPKRTKTGAAIEAAIIGDRTVHFGDSGSRQAVIYDGLSLEPDMELTGPAVIQEASVTLVVPPPHKVRIDDYGNYHVLIEPKRGAEQ